MTVVSDAARDAAAAGAGRRRRAWHVPLGVVAAATAILMAWPALDQGVASGDGAGDVTTAAELTLSATARQLGAYRSAAAVIARMAAASEPTAPPTTAPAPTTTGPPPTTAAPPTTAPPPPTTAAPAPAAEAAAPETAPPAPPVAAPPPPPPVETPTATQAPPAAAAVAVSAPAPVAPAPTGTDAAAEARFVELVNGLRSSLGLAPVAPDGRLQGAARSWARGLADQGGLSHQDLNPFLDVWYTAGENIAFGPSADAVFNALVSSPRHYANMARGDFSVIGVGAVVGPDGRLWTSHVFAG